jgi:predicted nucleotidyltransferase
MLDVTQDLALEAIVDQSRRYRVGELSLFGSALRDDFRPDGDLDLLVEFEPEARASVVTLGRMERDLESLHGRKVDLIPKGGLRPVLRGHVFSTAKILYAA